MAEPPTLGSVVFSPSQFLADNELFLDQENLVGKGLRAELTQSWLGFPNEFPFEFDSPRFSSAFSSPGDSTETEENSDDEEDFLAGLTRRLALSAQRVPVPRFTDEKAKEKSRAIACSPQSTLSGLGSLSASSDGSPNGPSSLMPSPPTTPFCNMDGTWDVIYAAAGRVARLNIGTEPQVIHPNTTNRTFHYPSRALNPVPPPRKLLDAGVSTLDPVPPTRKSLDSGIYSKRGVSHHFAHTNQYKALEEALTQQRFSIWGKQPKVLNEQAETKYQYPEHIYHKRVFGSVGNDNGRYIRPLERQMSECAPALSVRQLRYTHSMAAAMKGGFPAGSGAKRECVGTGVFLPRRYPTPSDSRKKIGCSNVLLPAMPTNLNFDMTGYGQPQQRFASGFGASNYDSATAKRNVLLAQQGSSIRPVGSALDQEIPLPQGWMY